MILVLSTFLPLLEMLASIFFVQALTSLMLMGLKENPKQIQLKDVPGISLRDTHVLFWLERVWLSRPKEATNLEPKVVEQNPFWTQICSFQAPII